MSSEKMALGAKPQAAVGVPRRALKRASRVGERAFPPFLFYLLVYRLLLEFGYWGILARFKVFLTLGFVAFLVWARNRLPRHPIVVCQLLFFAWSLVGVLFADNSHWAYMAFKEVYANTVVSLSIVLIFGHGRLVSGVWAWVAIMAYGAYYALTHGGEGAGSALGDPNENSMAMGCAFAVAFCALEYYGGRKRLLALALAILFAITVTASFSRGGFVGLAATLLYCIATSRRKVLNGGLAVLGVVALFAFAPATYVDELASISKTDEGTANTRQFFWVTSFNMWKANPVMGVGGYGVRYQLPDYIPEDFEVRDEKQRRALYDKNFGGKAVHSLYFQLLPEQGLIGIGIWGFMVFSFFRTLRKLRRLVRSHRSASRELVRRTDFLARGLGGAMIAYLTGGAFVSVAYYPFAWYFAGMALATDITVRRELSELSSRPQR